MHHHLFRIVPYAVMAASLGLSGMTALAPVPNRPVAAFFPQWWSADSTFGAAARSGAPIVSFAAFASIPVRAPAARNGALDEGLLAYGNRVDLNGGWVRQPSGFRCAFRIWSASSGSGRAVGERTFLNREAEREAGRAAEGGLSSDAIMPGKVPAIA
ncbi:MAG: hypothetical protein ABSC06_32135 [Rhodopila sp.]